MVPGIVSGIRTKWSSVLGLIALLIVGPTCGSGGGGGSGGGPTPPPPFNVVAHFPAQGAAGIGRVSSIYLTVNGVVNPATMAGNITLRGTNPVPITLTWNPTQSQIEIRPQGGAFMEMNATHTVDVLAGLMTVGGSSMTPMSFTFSTANSTDTSPPTFGGATSVTPTSTTSVTVNWSAGSDPAGTPPAGLVYDVYYAIASGQVNFGQLPLATSAAGATSVPVTGLSPNTTYFLVVRCRDGGGSRDNNVQETSAKTLVSFATNIYGPIINNPATGHCTTCHNPTGISSFMPLDGGASDVVNTWWVNKNTDTGSGSTQACQSETLFRVKPFEHLNSVVYRKVAPDDAGHPRCGVRMPEDGLTTGYLNAAQIKLFEDWINQGAIDN